MKRFTFLLSCLMANFYLFGQGGSGPMTNNFYLFGNNNAYYYPSQNPQMISSEASLPNLVARPNADIYLCEKQVLQVGGTSNSAQLP